MAHPWALLWILLLLHFPSINLEDSSINSSTISAETGGEAISTPVNPAGPGLGSAPESDMQTSISPELQAPGDGDDAPARLPRMSLSEFKRRMASKMQKTLHCSGPEQAIRHRLETGGGAEYNFAAASHGAKLVASNKDSKGGASILQNDKEKYYRSPCSVEKFVVVQLSEEALVDSFLIANYELYASNLKEFELYGSLSYPSEEWRLLGSFEAENTRHAHRFRLAKPEWVRYLKLQMVSHYGTEFYCTLSSLEVYGIDAIECLLEDWVGAPGLDESSSSSETSGDLSSVVEGGGGGEGDVVQQLVGSPSRLGDSVMKLIMQKVQALEINQSLFERYVEELENNYKDHFGYLEENIVASRRAVQNLTATIASLVTLIRKMESDWEAERDHQKSELRRHVEAEASYVHYVKSRIEHMENREALAISAALFVMLVSGVGRLFSSTIFDRSHYLLACFACLSVIILSA